MDGGQSYTNLFVKQLRDYYGNAADLAVVEYVKKNFYIPDVDYCNRLVTWMQENRPKNFGFPDIEALGKCLLQNPIEKKVAHFYANKCMKCGTVYGFSMMACPTCYKHGFIVSETSVMASELPIDQIKFNRAGYGSPEGNCYRCKNNFESLCEHFGDSNWDCRSSVFESCKCRKCCAEDKAYHKKMMERLGQRKDDFRNVSYDDCKDWQKVVW